MSFHIPDPSLTLMQREFKVLVQKGKSYTHPTLVSLLLKMGIWVEPNGLERASPKFRKAGPQKYGPK